MTVFSGNTRLKRTGGDFKIDSEQKYGVIGRVSEVDVVNLSSIKSNDHTACTYFSRLVPALIINRLGRDPDRFISPFWSPHKPGVQNRLQSFFCMSRIGASIEDRAD